MSRSIHVLSFVLFCFWYLYKHVCANLFSATCYCHPTTHSSILASVFSTYFIVIDTLLYFFYSLYNFVPPFSVSPRFKPFTIVVLLCYNLVNFALLVSSYPNNEYSKYNTRLSQGPPPSSMQYRYQHMEGQIKSLLGSTDTRSSSRSTDYGPGREEHRIKA